MSSSLAKVAILQQWVKRSQPPSSGQGGLTEVTQALLQRKARGSLGGGEKGDEAEHPVVGRGTVTAADGQRSHELAAVGLPGEGREHETANRSGVMKRIDQTDEGCASWRSQMDQAGDEAQAKPDLRGKNDSCPICAAAAQGGRSVAG